MPVNSLMMLGEDGALNLFLNTQEPVLSPTCYKMGAASRQHLGSPKNHSQMRIFSPKTANWVIYFLVANT